MSRAQNATQTVWGHIWGPTAPVVAGCKGEKGGDSTVCWWEETRVVVCAPAHVEEGARASTHTLTQCRPRGPSSTWRCICHRGRHLATLPLLPSHHLKSSQRIRALLRVGDPQVEGKAPHFYQRAPGLPTACSYPPNEHCGQAFHMLSYLCTQNNPVAFLPFTGPTGITKGGQDRSLTKGALGPTGTQTHGSGSQGDRPSGTQPKEQGWGSGGPFPS